MNALISTSLYFGVGLNEGVHLIACQLDDSARVTHTEAHLRGATKDHADVTGELRRSDNRRPESPPVPMGE